MCVHEDKLPVGNGTYVRIADVKLEVTSKKKGWLWWSKKKADLSMSGSGTVGDQFGANGTFTVNKSENNTKKLKHTINQVALGSNDNKQKFQSPTSVTFDSHKTNPCTISQ